MGVTPDLWSSMCWWSRRRDETALPPGVAELDPAQPPSIDLATENLERQGRQRR
jgi:hypothetical protein